MKMILTLFALLLFLGEAVLAQQIPAESAKATIVQRVGLDDVTIAYQRPNVNHRKIWGVLVPYGKVWRTGADYPTFVTLTDETVIEGKSALPPGKYALYTIPGEKTWTVIFSKNTKLWGAFGYEEKDDALRVEVKPEACDFTETFTIDFANITDDSATLALRWERVRVPIRIEVNIQQKVLSYAKEVIANGKADMSFYWKAAKYLLKHNLEPELALQWADKSIALDANWINLWVKAQLLATRRDYKAALEFGQRALEKGKAAGVFFPYAQLYSEEIDKWKKAAKD